MGDMYKLLSGSRAGYQASRIRLVNLKVNVTQLRAAHVAAQRRWRAEKLKRAHRCIGGGSS
jgi:hypothetical protein